MGAFPIAMTSHTPARLSRTDAIRPQAEHVMRGRDAVTGNV